MRRRLGFWLIVVATVVWSAVMLGAASNGAVEFGVGLILQLTGFLLVVAWAVVTVWSGAVWEPRWRWVWFPLPAVGALAVVVAATHVPFTARLWASEAAVRTYAENAQPDPAFLLPPEPRRVGLFEVTRVRKRGNVVLLQTCHTGFEQVGIAYAPRVRPARADPDYEFVHLYGPWYRWERLRKSDGW